MLHPHRLIIVCVIAALVFVARADTPNLGKITSEAELDAAIASTTDSTLKQALSEHRHKILQAIEEHSHVAEVTRVVEGARGKVEKVNTTPEALKKAAGGELAVFDTLKLVDLAVPNTGPHDKRTVDPYDQAFFEHLGHLSAIESLNIISTKFNDAWMPSISKLITLKTLRFTNNGKLTDKGLEQLAGLKNMEAFNFVGTAMTGRAFAKFDGWTHLTKCSFRGSSIDDEGLKELCAHFSNLESISLAHAKFTDAGAVHLAKLTKLKGLELGTHTATPACLQNLKSLPLEYLQLGDGLDAADGIAACQDLPSLRRLTLTHCDHLTDEGLQLAEKLTQLQQLEIGGLELPDERLPQLKGFSFLKELKLVRRPQSYPPETQGKIKALLPGVAVSFQ
jgi:hypothetical protein